MKRRVVAILLALLIGSPLISEFFERIGSLHATVNEVTVRNDYTGNGSMTAFTYSFRILTKNDIEVMVDGATQTVDTDYTVSGLGESDGGTVSFITAPASATAVTLIRKQPIEQQTNYLNNQTFASRAATIEKDLDKAIMTQQMQAETLVRSLKVPKKSTLSGNQLEVPVDSCNNDFIKWNATTTGFECATLTSSRTIADPVPAANGGTGLDNATGVVKASLPAARTAGRIARVTDDVRGRWIDQGSQWFSLSREVANVEEFGARGDGTTDDTTAINKAISSGTKFVFFPAGTYKITAAISPTIGQIWQGSGEPGVTIIKQATANMNALTVTDIGGWQLRDLELNGGSGTGSGLVARADTTGVANVYLYNVRIRSSGQDGIRLEGVNKWRLYNIEVTNNGRDGISLTNGGAGFGSVDNVYFYGCFSGSNSGKGLTIATASQNNLFSGCAFESNTGIGIEVLGSPNTFSHVHAEGNSTGWLFNSTGYNRCYNCRALAHSSHGFDLRSQVALYSPAADSNTGDDYNLSASISNVTIIDPIGTVNDRNGGNLIIGAGLATQDFGGATVISHGKGNTLITRTVTNTQSVTTSAVTIFSNMGDAGSVMYVAGIKTDNSARFLDIVIGGTQVNPSTLHSFTTDGSPSARTYTRSSNALQLTMAADTYDITVTATMMPTPN